MVYRLFLEKLFVLCLTFLVGGCSQVGRSPESSSRHFHAEKVWVKETLNNPYLQAQVLHRMKPILAGDYIFAGNSIDGLVAYENKDGSQVWRKDIVGGVESGAVLHNGHLFFGAGDGFFHKIKALDGQTVWTFPIQAEGLSLPAIHENFVYFIAGNGVAYCLDKNTGKSKWRYNRTRSSYLSVRGGSRPLVHNGVVYVGFSDGYLVALNAKNGSMIWEKKLNRNKKFKDIDSEPVLAGNMILVSNYDGELVAINKADGLIRWRSDFGGHSRPLIKDERVYVSSSQNFLAALDLGSGRTLWSYQTRSLPTQPSFHSGLVIVGEYSGTLKFLDSETGKLVREFHPGRGVHSKVEVDEPNSKLYFMSSNANLFALKVAWKRFEGRWPWEKLNP